MVQKCTSSHDRVNVHMNTELYACETRELYACETRELYACETRELYACESRELYARESRDLYARESRDLYRVNVHMNTELYACETREQRDKECCSGATGDGALTLKLAWTWYICFNGR